MQLKAVRDVRAKARELRAAGVSHFSSGDQILSEEDYNQAERNVKEIYGINEDEPIDDQTAYLKGIATEQWRRFARICWSIGIFAVSDFSCCMSCGHAEINEELEKVKTKKRAERPAPLLGPSEEERQGEVIDGYVFYHAQDTDRINQMIKIMKPGQNIPIFLSWGYFDIKQQDSQEQATGKRLAGRVRAAARAAGLELYFKDWSEKLTLIMKLGQSTE